MNSIKWCALKKNVKKKKSTNHCTNAIFGDVGDADRGGKGRGVCARPQALRVRRPRCPDGAPGEGGEGTSLPGTFLGGRGGARRVPGRTPEVSPLSPGAGAAASIRLCHFMCDRSSAGSPRQLTDLSAVVPTRGTILGNYFPVCGSLTQWVWDLIISQKHPSYHLAVADRKSTRLNSSHKHRSRMPSSA